MLINGKKIGLNQPTYFIADIAANHDGDLQRAKKLIQLAAQSGANAAKFQHFRAEFIVSKSGFEKLGGKLAHQESWSKSVFEVYQDASLPWEWTSELEETCREFGIDFFTTPYDIETIDFINDYVSVFKVGSGDINWFESIKHMATKNKPILIATGASNLTEVDDVYNLLKDLKVEFSLMQCNTNYTGDLSNIFFSNLSVLNQFKSRYPNIVLGLSDHTDGDLTVLAAISLGARIIEKHFTDDISRVGPDHKFSMNPITWRSMIDKARLLEKSLGDGEKKVEENELESRIVQRRSLRYRKSLGKDHILKREDISVLRPAPVESLSPIYIDELIGKRINQDVSQDELVSLNHFIE